MDAHKTEDDIMSGLLDYAMDKNKTYGGQRFVSGINCFPATAHEKMQATKEKYHKEDGRIAYHIIQSFSPGEITPELAHEIGKQYAERWLNDFEVVIGTHLDRDHIHNHLIVNSVSCMDGHKFHMSRQDFYDKLYGISNELCEQNGLSVIRFVDGNRISFGEYAKRYGGKRTLRRIAIDDIHSCIDNATSIGDFYILLENLGYEVVVSGKYPKIRAPEAERFFRLATLGFTTERIEALIESGEYNKIRKPRRLRIFGKKHFPRQKLTRIQALYLKYLYLLGEIKKNPARAVIPISEYRKFDAYKMQLKFISQNGISKLSEVAERRDEVLEFLALLKDERDALHKMKVANKELFNAHTVYERYHSVDYKLDAERRQMLNQAMGIIRAHGYADNISTIKDMRIQLAEKQEQNRFQTMMQKRDLRHLEDILKSHETINRNIQREHDTHKKQSDLIQKRAEPMFSDKQPAKPSKPEKG
jgi:hypothetical protein